MNTVRGYHIEASRLAQLAMVARDKGEQEKARELARQSYELECVALDMLPEDSSAEPTRSILTLSAASLAYQCGKLEEALHLVTSGLAGCPPALIGRDLLALAQQINADKHKREESEEGS